MALNYYLISSLPDISSEGEMPCTYDEFLTMCESNISDKKFNDLKNLSLDSTEGPLMEDWGRFYHNLIGELNLQRSGLLNQSYSTDYDKDLENTRIVQLAINADNPLEAEKLLLNHQFDVIDTLVGLHDYDDIFLFGYAIKLKLLERQSCFKKEKGEKVFQYLIASVQQKVYGIIPEK